MSDNPKLLIIGSVNVDLILGMLDELPGRGTEVMMSQKETRVGGNAANTAFAFGALGGRCRIVANIGADMFGDWVGAAFPEESRHWPRSALPTTISVGLTHSDGERTFLTSSGHLESFTLENALGQIPAEAGKGDVALLCSPFLMPLLMAELETLIAELHKRGYQVALDTGWPPQGWTVEIRTRLAGWLRAADHVLLSENEALAFAGCDDLEQALDTLEGLIGPEAALVVKCGPNGAVTREDGRTLSMPAPKVAVVDTIGAGDIFNAGYLHGHMQGEALFARLASGVEAASAAISTLPRRYGTVR